MLDWTVIKLRENEEVPAAFPLLSGSELPTVIILLENCEVLSESRLSVELLTVIMLLENVKFVRKGR